MEINMEYDNTNRVGLFQPRGDKKIIFDGKLNVDGTDVNALVVRATSKDGTPYRNLYINAGPIYANEDKAKDTIPDIGGTVQLLGMAKRIGLYWKDYMDRVTNETKQMLTGSLREVNTDYLNGANDSGRNEYRDAKDGRTPQITQAEATQTQPKEEDLNDEIPF